ncbi:MAG: hypothetical protein R3222_08165, partial [Balneolaceae bacterium]|nr:hypothetical protein [Balneolaceae bacterium]
MNISKEQIQQLGQETVWGGLFRAYMVSILSSKGDTEGARSYLDELRTSDAFPAMIGQAYASLDELDVHSVLTKSSVNQSGVTLAPV